MTDPIQRRKNMWSFLEHNVLGPSTRSETESIQTEFDWLQAIAEWRDFYREQSRLFGSSMRSGAQRPIPVKPVRERRSRLLKRLDNGVVPYETYFWFDEHIRLDRVFPAPHYTVLKDGTVTYNENMTMAGESNTIEKRHRRIQALPKVSRVRNKQSRSRKKS